MTDSTNPGPPAEMIFKAGTESGRPAPKMDPFGPLMADHAAGRITTAELLSRMAEMHAWFIERGDV